MYETIEQNHYFINLLLEEMKNLRIAKKDPSKILKIIEAPQTHRYNSHIETTNINQIAIISSRSKEVKKNSLTYRQQPTIHSPSRSQHIIDLNFTDKNKKIRSRSLNNSQDAIKSQEKRSFNFVMRNSVEMKVKNDVRQYSPYIRRHTFRESQKLLKFQSINIGDKRHKKDGSELRGIIKNASRIKTFNYRADSSREQLESIKKKSNETMESARILLSQGQYRKSLLIIKSLLKNQPDLIEALYLSALNWFHLDDRPKAILYLEQIIQYDPVYSAQCYKILAVCHFKSMEYNRSLMRLKECHEYFANQSESYELQGKIYSKMGKWNTAIDSYNKAYQITNNVDHLVMIGSCLQQLKQFEEALTYYNRALDGKEPYSKLVYKKMKLYLKLAQYQNIIKLFNDCDGYNQSFENSKDKSQIYYLTAYSYYKLKNYHLSIPLIDEGLKMSDGISKFKKLLLMIKIDERCIYDAFHLVGSMQKQPQLRVMMKFVEGVISLMRRNYNQGISILLSIQNQLGLKLQTSRFSNSSVSNYEEESKFIGREVDDQFLNQIRKIYLLFLSYGYFSIAEFHSCGKLIQLQRQIGVPVYFEMGLEYNYNMCEGILNNCQKKFKEAEPFFLKAKKMYQAKLEPPFSLALNYLQLMVNANSESEKIQMIKRAQQQFRECKQLLGNGSSNTSASVYYFSSLLSASIEDWKQALLNIDESIDRSEDHYWRYYYIRGMLLACVHSFRQAINDLSIAINLSGNSKPECYLLRSKCFQIEGDGGEAFKDLQEYISMKPDDPEVHKYAGQLLFQNGAFEDALTAFSHQNIPEIPSNYDIFMTQGKSLFLLGRFKQAQLVINKAYLMNKSQEVFFDMQILQILQLMTHKVEPSLEIRNKFEVLYKDFNCMGKIFKKTDYHVFRGICFIEEKLFQQAIEAFRLAINEKTLEMQNSGEQEDIISFENKKDLQMFTSQMRYNIVVCHLSQGNLEKAVEVSLNMHVDLDQPYYCDFVNFKKFLTREIETLKKYEVFPGKNKMSNYLDRVHFSVKSRQSEKKIECQLKLCVPFPKVEPPEIFPIFDNSLLFKLSVLNVDRKPQAPWIIRQNNSIKFTEKIETFSNFLLQDSESESQSTYQMISIDNSHVNRHSSRHFNKSKTSQFQSQQVTLIK